LKFALGPYVGETVRQALGGAWAADGDGPTAEMNIGLHLPDGSIIWPVQRVIKRFRIRGQHAAPRCPARRAIRTERPVPPGIDRPRRTLTGASVT
jgi:hypothetical protein